VRVGEELLRWRCAIFGFFAPGPTKKKTKRDPVAMQCHRSLVTFSDGPTDFLGNVSSDINSLSKKTFKSNGFQRIFGSKHAKNNGFLACMSVGFQRIFVQVG
jgi:hypothetical protein